MATLSVSVTTDFSAQVLSNITIIDFTNALIERYHFAWVNEDLGLWSRLQ